MRGLVDPFFAASFALDLAGLLLQLALGLVDLAAPFRRSVTGGPADFFFDFALDLPRFAFDHLVHRGTSYRLSRYRAGGVPLLRRPLDSAAGHAVLNQIVK